MYWPLTFPFKVAVTGGSVCGSSRIWAKGNRLPDASFPAGPKEQPEHFIYLLGSRGRLQLSHRDEIVALGDTHQ